MDNPYPNQKMIVSYGGGTNSVAVLVLLAQNGIVPTAIVMADPGSEHEHTYRYRDEVMPPWLESQGFPSITVVNRKEEGRYNPRAWRLETLYEECMRIHSLPSIAYGWKKCSDKYKAQPSRWWAKRQPWVDWEWKAGRKITKVIGYDAGEERRVRKAFQNDWENKRFVPWYPLVDEHIDRDGCEDLILSEGLPLPGKSSCTYCPSSQLEEWIELRDNEPEAFAEAVAMSRNSKLTSPEVVGLMRCNKHGQRQLHIWAEGGYGCNVKGGRTDDDDLPCECTL